MISSTPKPREPLSAAKHFWLSFLAVVTGIPVAVTIISIGWIILMIMFVAMIAVSIPSGSSSTMPLTQVFEEKGSGISKSVIVSIPIRGPILSGTAADPLQTLFGYSFTDGEATKEYLREIANDQSVKAVVLEIDSPGGMITASKAIADGISYFQQQTDKPVYAHINGSGSSGAYWIASGADKIYAEQGSEAGSIGVIMGPLVTLKEVVAYGDVATRTPIEFRYFTAGRSKDIGNPFRDMTPEEADFLNQQLTVEYDKFVSHVATNREITVDSIKNEIGALGYGTDDAIRLKLIDGMKSKEDVYQELARSAGIGGGYKVMQLNTTPDFFSSLFGVRSFVQSFTMSEADKSAGRKRFCETVLADRPLVYAGDITAVCR